MFEQYPDTINLSWTGEPTINDDGDPVPGQTVNFQSECRAEPNGKGQSVASADGTIIIPNYTVYMPAAATIIPDGASGTLTKSGKQINAIVKRFEPGTFNSRLWL